MDSKEQLAEQLRQIIHETVCHSASMDSPNLAGDILGEDAEIVDLLMPVIRSHTDALVAAAVEDLYQRIGARFNEREPHNGAWAEPMLVVREQYYKSTPDHAHRALELREVKARITVLQEIESVIAGQGIGACQAFVEMLICKAERHREELEGEKQK